MPANKGSAGAADGGMDKTPKKLKTDNYKDNSVTGYGGRPLSWSQTDLEVHVDIGLVGREGQYMLDVILHDNILVLVVNGYEFWHCRLDKPVKSTIKFCKSQCGTKVNVTLLKSRPGEKWLLLGEQFISDDDDEVLSPAAEKQLAYRELSFVKDDFIERGDCVTYVVYIDEVVKDSVHVAFNPNSFSLTFSTTSRKFLESHSPASSKTVFYRRVKTRYPYDHSTSSLKIGNRKVEITLVKHLQSRHVRWSSVEAPSASDGVVPPVSPAIDSGEWQPLGTKELSPSETSGRRTMPARLDEVRLTPAGDSEDRTEPDGSPSTLSRANRSGSDSENRSLPIDSSSRYSFAGEAIVSTKTDLRSCNDSSSKSSSASSWPMSQVKPTCVVPPHGRHDASAPLASSLVGPTSESRLTGLFNLGNTCFMNAVLQVLASTPQMFDYFISGRFKKDLNKSNPLGTGGRIAEAFANLMRSLWQGGRRNIQPTEFKEAIVEKAGMFLDPAQHDAHEFLSFLLDGLHEDLNKVKSKPYVPSSDADDGISDEELARRSWDAYRRRNDSAIVDVFQGQYKSTLVCPQCKKVSITFDPYMYLSVPIPRKKVPVYVYFIRRQPVIKPIKYKLALPETCTTDQVLQELSVLTSVPVTNLRLYETQGKSPKFYDVGMPFSVTADSNDRLVFASEVLTRQLAGENVLELRVVQCTAMPTKTAVCCAECRGRPRPKLNRCTGCFRVVYCNESCQRKHWSIHKDQCDRRDPVGQPFVITIQESRASYRCIAEAMKELASYSVSLFHRLQSRQAGTAAAAAGQPSPSFSPTASELGQSSLPGDWPAAAAGGDAASPAASRCSTGLDNDSKAPSAGSSLADTAAAGQPPGAASLGCDAVSDGEEREGQKAATGRKREGEDVTFSLGESFCSRRRLSGTVDDDEDDMRSTDVCAPAPRPLPLVRAASSPTSRRARASPTQAIEDGDGNAALPTEPTAGHSSAAIAGTGEQSGLAADLEASSLPVSPHPMQSSSASDLRTPSPSRSAWGDDNSTDAVAESQASTLDFSGFCEPPTSPLSRPMRLVVGVAQAPEPGSNGDEGRRRFPFSIRRGWVSRTVKSSEPLSDEGDRPLSFTMPLLRKSNVVDLTMEWHNDDRLPDYVLVGSKELEHERDASCSVATEEEVTLEQCMQLFSEPEKLMPDDAWFCPRCKEHREASKQLSLWSLPDIVIVHLKRFSFARSFYRDKVETMVKCPIRGLDLSPYCVRPSLRESSQLYDLYGVINHYGCSVFGHYTAYARYVTDGSQPAPFESGQGWLSYDDATVLSIHESAVVTADAYVLLYQKRPLSTAPPSSSRAERAHSIDSDGGGVAVVSSASDLAPLRSPRLRSAGVGGGGDAAAVASGSRLSAPAKSSYAHSTRDGAEVNDDGDEKESGMREERPPNGMLLDSGSDGLSPAATCLSSVRHDGCRDQAADSGTNMEELD